MVFQAPEVYEDVGDIANVVAVGGRVQQSRSNTNESEATNYPLEEEICSLVVILPMSA